MFRFPRTFSSILMIAIIGLTIGSSAARAEETKQFAAPAGLTVATPAPASTPQASPATPPAATTPTTATPAAPATADTTAEAPKPVPENPARYAPDFCDFEITFPEPPSIAQKCVPGAACYQVYSYTMVYDLQTTVDMSVTCTPSTQANYDRYSEKVMRIALEGIAGSRDLKSHDIQYTTIDGAKSAVLTGVGIRGAQDEIFISQLWIGKNSVFTVQAELVGSAHVKADKAFHDILASIKTKEGKQVAVPGDKEEKKDDKKDAPKGVYKRPHNL